MLEQSCYGREYGTKSGDFCLVCRSMDGSVNGRKNTEVFIAVLPTLSLDLVTISQQECRASRQSSISGYHCNHVLSQQGSTQAISQYTPDRTRY